MSGVWGAYSRKYGAMSLLWYSYASWLQDVGNSRGGSDCCGHYGDNFISNFTIKPNKYEND